MFEQRVQVGRERVVVVAHGRLARAAEPAAVIADTAVAGGEQHALLSLPRVTVERVAVDQNDGAPGAVVVVMDLNVGLVLSSDFDEWHGPILSCSRWLSPRRIGHVAIFPTR